MPTPIILSGISGEYFVAGELSRRGIMAAITLRNTANIDIIATDPVTFKTANIQVKTRRVDKADGWDLGSNPLEVKKEYRNIFYVFVALSSDPNNQKIDYYIIPKNKLNRLVESTFQNWRKGKKKTGEPRTSERRIFRMREELPELQQYRDKWDIIF